MAKILVETLIARLQQQKQRIASLTDTICGVVTTVGTLPTLLDNCPYPWPAPVVNLLRAQLQTLHRDLKASNRLVERAADFRGLYATPPEPIAGHSAASYHELGRDLAMELMQNVMQSLICDWIVLTESDFESVVDPNNLPAVQQYLCEKALRFDWELLVARIRDEEAKAKQRAAIKKEQGEGNGGGSKNRRGGGRKKDPKVQSRNKKIAADFRKGLDVNAVVEKYGISAELARRLKSDIGKTDKSAENRQS